MNNQQTGEIKMSTIKIDDVSQKQFCEAGMTKREHLASLNLQALISANSSFIAESRTMKEHYVLCAIQTADFLIKKLNEETK